MASFSICHHWICIIKKQDYNDNINHLRNIFNSILYLLFFPTKRRREITKDLKELLSILPISQIVEAWGRNKKDSS
jgi:hypothetical protein